MTILNQTYAKVASLGLLCAVLTSSQPAQASIFDARACLVRLNEIIPDAVDPSALKAIAQDLTAAITTANAHYGKFSEEELAAQRLIGVTARCEKALKKEAEIEIESTSLKRKLGGFDTEGKGAYISFVTDTDKENRHLGKIAYFTENRKRPVIWELSLNPKSCCFIKVLSSKEATTSKASDNAFKYFTRDFAQRLNELDHRATLIRGQFPFGESKSIANTWKGNLVLKRTDSGGPSSMYFDKDDINYAQSQKRVFDNSKITTLPRSHYYTYVLTAYGEVSYGLVNDVWEYGVKHFHIARLRPIVAAGELFIDANGQVTFNLESGTFTKNIIQMKHVPQKEIELGVQRLFVDELGNPDLVRYTDRVLFQQLDLPSLREKQKLCGFKHFTNHNPNFCLTQ